MIKDLKELDLSKHYTYADYLTWQFDDIVELIKGKIFRVSPSPGTAHQWVSGEIYFLISQYLRGKKCKAFSAPFDVRLPIISKNTEDQNITTVVQPDIFVLCDLSKLDGKGCQGPPDWIIEILSQSTSQKDLTDKFEIYQNAGVREYWVIHPHEGTVLAYVLDENGRYQSVRTNPYVRGEAVPVGIFPGFNLLLEGVFPDEGLFGE